MKFINLTYDDIMIRVRENMKLELCFGDCVCKGEVGGSVESWVVQSLATLDDSTYM